MWLLSKEVYYKLIPKKTKNFIKEFYQRGLKRTETVRKEKISYDPNLLWTRSSLRKPLSFQHGLHRKGRIMLAEPKAQRVKPRAVEKTSQGAGLCHNQTGNMWLPDFRIAMD